MTHPGYDTLGWNQDFWPEKAAERAQREVKNPPIVFTHEDCVRHIDAMLARMKREHEEGRIGDTPIKVVAK